MLRFDNESCFLSYSNLVVFPFSPSLSWVGTCARNMGKRSHRIISDKPLRELWNADCFQVQRKIANARKIKNCLLRFPCFDYKESFFNRGLDVGGHAEKVHQSIDSHKEILTYLPLSIIVAFSNKCMNKCAHCLNSPRRKNIDLNDRHKKEILEELIPETQYVEFTGGEPLLNNLNDIINIFKRYPGKKYRLSTNGVLLNELNLSDVPEDTVFVVSLYGFDSRSYREITRTNNFQKVFNALTDLIRQGYGKKLFLKYVVYDASITTLKPFCEFVKKNHSLRGAAIVSDSAAGSSMYPAMQKVQSEYNEDNFEWIFTGSSGLHRIVNSIFDPFYSFRWQLERCSLVWRKKGF
jgi:sulfatase maturation enzyme AslB (radical SAM superfamily)